MGAVKRGFGPLPLLLPALLLALLATFAPVAPAVSRCAAAGQNHASLVVEHADGSVVDRCVAFDAASISGEQLLTLSGVSWSGQTFGAFGVAVCALDAEPVRYAECPGKDYYWAVFVARTGGSWQLANVGISSLQLGVGDAVGFRYVPASGVPAAPVSATGACPSPTPTPTPTPTPVLTPPTATATTVRPAPTASRAAEAAPSTPALGPVAVVAGLTAAPTSSSVPAAPAGGVAAVSPTTAPQAPIPAPTGSGGPDVGLLAAAVAGGGLAGLAVLRLRAGRRRST